MQILKDAGVMGNWTGDVSDILDGFILNAAETEERLINKGTKWALANKLVPISN